MTSELIDKRQRLYIGEIDTVKYVTLLLAVLIAATLSGCGGSSPATVGATSGTSKPAAVRLGYFANLTHAQALLGVANGSFQKAIGDVPLKTTVFNAGPSVVEAFFANELDLAYVGPSPALNAHVKSHGSAVRVISGSASNGVVIVARKDAGIAKMADLAGKRIATPQFGNTQDISARHYVLSVLKQTLKNAGGTTDIQNIANAEQLGLFKSGQLDAVWAPEPWGARLVHEADGVLVEEEKNLWPEKNFTITLVLASQKFLTEHPDVVEQFLKAHVEITGWLNTHRDEAADAANAELQKLTGKSLKKDMLLDAYSRIGFSTDVFLDSIKTFADWAYELKVAKEQPDLKGFIDLSILEKAKAANAAGSAK